MRGAEGAGSTTRTSAKHGSSARARQRLAAARQLSRHRLTPPGVEQPARDLVPLDRRANRSTRTERIAQHRELLLDRPGAPARHARHHLDPTTHTIARMTTRSLINLPIHRALRPKRPSIAAPASSQGGLQATLTVKSLRRFLETSLARASGKGKLAEAIRYALNRWDGLCRFLDDGRIEIDSNTVERSIRPLALNRKNALFAGSDQGGDHWAVIASLIETCKLNRIDPQAWLSATLTRLVEGHPASALGQLMPWTSAPDVA